jgi:hypothetical protein
LLSVCLASCDDQRKDGKLTILNVEAAIEDQRPLDISEIIDRTEFFALAGQTKESLIGDILSINESETGFFIFHDIESSIKVFDKTGMFISSKGTIGRGPNEYLFLRGITVDHSNDNTYVMTRDGSIIGYDHADKMFTRNDSVPDGDIVYHKGRLILLRRNFGSLADNHIAKAPVIEIYTQNLLRESAINVQYKGNAVAAVGSFETGVSTVLVGQFMSDNGESLLVKQGRNDTVYVYKNNMSLEPAYKLEMGHYSPPAEMFEGLKSLEEWKKYYSVEQMFEGTKYIITEVANGVFRARSFLVFDRRDPSGGVMATGVDGRSGFFIDGIKFTPCYIRDNRLVGYMQALDIVDNAASITNPELKALAATLKEDSNPVIVVAKLKK